MPVLNSGQSRLIRYQFLFFFFQVSQVNDREFLVVLIATNYSICHSANEINDLDTCKC